MIKHEQVKKVAHLGHLELSEKEVSVYAKELSRVLDFFEILEKVDTDDVQPLLCSAEISDVMRVDNQQASGIEQDIISGAPERKKNYIKTRLFSKNQ